MTRHRFAPSVMPVVGLFLLSAGGGRPSRHTRGVGAQPLEFRILEALTTADATAEALSERLSAPSAEVERGLLWALGEELVTRTDLPSGTSYSLTTSALPLIEQRRQLDAVLGPHGHIDPIELAELEVREASRRQLRQLRLAEAHQAGIPADDAWRDWAIKALSDAYAAGRITREELDRRVGLALQSPTMGALRAATGGVVRLPLVPGLPLPQAGPVAALRSTPTSAGEIVRWMVLGIVVIMIATLSGDVVVVVGAVAIAVLLLRRRVYDRLRSRSGAPPTGRGPTGIGG